MRLYALWMVKQVGLTNLIVKLLLALTGICRQHFGRDLSPVRQLAVEHIPKPTVPQHIVIVVCGSFDLGLRKCLRVPTVDAQSRLECLVSWVKKV